MPVGLRHAWLSPWKLASVAIVSIAGLVALWSMSGKADPSHKAENVEINRPASHQPQATAALRDEAFSRAVATGPLGVALASKVDANSEPEGSEPRSGAPASEAPSSDQLIASIVGKSVEELCEWDLVNPYKIELNEVEAAWLKNLIAIHGSQLDDAWKDVQTRMHHYVRELRSVGDFEVVEGRPGGRPEPEFPGQMTAYILKGGVLGAVRISPGDFPDLDAFAERERDTQRAFFNEIASFFTAPFDPGPAPPPRKYGIMIK